MGQMPFKIRGHLTAVRHLTGLTRTVTDASAIEAGLLHLHGVSEAEFL
jgi:hypothetical protein